MFILKFKKKKGILYYLTEPVKPFIMKAMQLSFSGGRT